MNTEKAIEFLEQIKYSNVYTPKKYQHEIENIQTLLKTKQEMVTKFSIDYYKELLKEMCKVHSLYHCLGYIQCMTTHEIVSFEEGLSLIDFAENLKIKGEI